MSWTRHETVSSHPASRKESLVSSNTEDNAHSTTAVDTRHTPSNATSASLSWTAAHLTISPEALRLYNASLANRETKPTSGNSHILTQVNLNSPSSRNDQNQSSRGFVPSIGKLVQSTEHTVLTRSEKLFENIAHDAQTAISEVKVSAAHVLNRVQSIYQSASKVAQKDWNGVTSKVEKIEHNMVQGVRGEVNAVSSTTRTVAHSVEKIASSVKSVKSEVEQGVHQLAARGETFLNAISEKSQKEVSGIEKKAIQAYHRVQMTVDRDATEAKHVLGNLAKHPGKTLEATAEVVGGAAETVAGAVGGTLSSETVIGTALGVAATIDGVNNVRSGVLDFKSLAEGKPEQVGTHNGIQNVLERNFGYSGREGYEIGSLFVGLTTGAGEIDLGEATSRGVEGIQNLIQYKLSGELAYNVDSYSYKYTVFNDNNFVSDVTKGVTEQNVNANVSKEAYLRSFLNGLNVTEVEVKPAEEANEFWVEKGYTNPPYKPGTKVVEFTLERDATFVRVFDDVHSFQAGGWLTRDSEIAGLTPEEVKDKLALHHVPKFQTNVLIPAGTRMRAGIANSISDWGSGGGIQYDLMDQRVGKFYNKQELK